MAIWNWVRGLGITVGMLLCCHIEAAEPNDMKRAELAWAEEILKDFLTTVVSGDTAQAAVFISAELRQSHAQEEVKIQTWLRQRIA